MVLLDEAHINAPRLISLLAHDNTHMLPLYLYTIPLKQKEDAGGYSSV